MHLYTYDSAPNPRRLGLFLAYKGIDLPTTQIDMRENKHRDAEFLAINPLGTLPALMTDEGVMLTEVIAICDYLDALYPDKPLMGSTALERALVISWDHRIFVSIFEAFAEMLRNRSPAFENRALPGPLDIEQIPELETRGRKRFRGSLELFDTELGDKPFLCGDSITFADIDLLVGVETARWVKESIPEGCDNLQAWLERSRAALS
ncbi:glutathione S-transferase family protein [Congregibacter brevis]|uniref:Glutathione S-transferase family protein n=1 Tax=Congregibacter brevis TaxID=3081201 RepID=A0ABZ0IGN0_9GAMM|nr:glutathione S-transferase family protein [Congregibacter sp. IMCC45268]